VIFADLQLNKYIINITQDGRIIHYEDSNHG